MAERMTSREEAADMKRAILGCVDALERRGYARGQIGAAMAGISIGIVAANDGLDAATRAIRGISTAIEQAASREDRG